ncbi:flagellar biosynthesis anti-sigma factor FlgM [Marinobacterium aestuarii]|uniref:Negative regulator of flagellin synthesis n=1 Tax=Marinobacterium aestuarii TaxID=1821621 RepID=A0A1A9EVD4_9GAMM|nr:flagellar biosynthesis anti-sigma factor FlgM [Marinobacterium aestuarii]ANG61720.1 flagellar biosynthesis anti-sigma factor FlgM [Marinobacterium aestuarii]
MVIDFTGLPPKSQASGTRAQTDNNRVGDQAQPQTPSAPRAGSAAEVRLSEAAQALQGADKALADTPEVNESRVQALRSAIESGSYEINYERLAQRMVDFESTLD